MKDKKTLRFKESMFDLDWDQIANTLGGEVEHIHPEFREIEIEIPCGKFLIEFEDDGDIEVIKKNKKGEFSDIQSVVAFFHGLNAVDKIENEIEDEVEEESEMEITDQDIIDYENKGDYFMENNKIIKESYGDGPQKLNTKKILGKDLIKLKNIPYEVKNAKLVDNSGVYFNSPNYGILSIEALDIETGGSNEIAYNYYYVTNADENSGNFGEYLGIYRGANYNESFNKDIVDFEIEEKQEIKKLNLKDLSFIEAGDSLVNEDNNLVHVLEFKDSSVFVYNIDKNTYRFPEKTIASDYYKAIQESNLNCSQVFDLLNETLENVNSLGLYDFNKVLEYIKENECKEITGVEKIEEIKSGTTYEVKVDGEWKTLVYYSDKEQRLGGQVTGGYPESEITNGMKQGWIRYKESNGDNIESKKTLVESKIKEKGDIPIEFVVDNNNLFFRVFKSRNMDKTISVIYDLKNNQIDISYHKMGSISKEDENIQKAVNQALMFSGNKRREYFANQEINNILKNPNILLNLFKESIEEADKKTAKCPDCGNDYLKKTNYCLSCKKKVKEEEEDKEDKEKEMENKIEESRYRNKMDFYDYKERVEEFLGSEVSEDDIRFYYQKDYSPLDAANSMLNESLKEASTATAKCPTCGNKYLKQTNYCLTCKKKVNKEDDSKEKEEKCDKKKESIENENQDKIEEARDGFTIVWITSNYSVVKSGIMDQRSYDKAYNDTKKEMKEMADTDDFWIDDIWYDGKDMPSGINWKTVLLPKGQFNEDLLEQILTDSYLPIKIQFLSNHGFDITEDNLDEVYVHDANGESWVEGHLRTWFPEDWLYDDFEQNNSKEKFIVENWSYFKEGIAKVYSDMDMNGKATFDKIDDYFVYSYGL
jgi:uncharacterized OB-fold protein